jgi:hypothetical protein
MARARKHRRPERRWSRKRVRRSEFLLSARSRLVADVGPYIALIKETSQRTSHGFGFWALARMMFPVVEAVSSVIYRTETTAAAREKKPVRLLRELGFEYPNLVWEMYRHTLMHNDEMATASYMGRYVGWEISVGGGHASIKHCLRVDAAKLYEDLLSFLAREASKPRRQGTHVWIGRSFRFNTAFSRATRAEMLRLGSPNRRAAKTGQAGLLAASAPASSP